MILIGNFLLIGSFCLLVAVMAGATINLRNGQEKWRTLAYRAMYSATGFVVLSSLLLLYALIQRDYRLDYIARHVSSTLPLEYCLTAFWAGQAGSLLFWLLLLMAFSAIALYLYRKPFPRLMPYFLLFSAGSALFFNLLLLTFTNPFTPSQPVPPDGLGMNPLLQNVMMVFHPPTLFLGYVGFTVPFAFAMATVLAGAESARWIKVVRRWTLASWIFLTIGIVLGMQWAYVELGWGGYWGWDPVENASFIPWLAATALLHTVILQENKGMFVRWNIFLVTMTFLLCIFGTFITRSGFIESVHAFAESNIGYYFLAFMLLVVLISLYLIFRNRNNLKSSQHFFRLASPEWSLVQWIIFLGFGTVLAGQVWPGAALIFSLAGSASILGVLYWKRAAMLSLIKRVSQLFSKEGAFLVTNFIFMAFLLFVLWGTIFPTLHEGVVDLYNGSSSAFRNSVASQMPGLDSFLSRKISLAATFFNKWVSPFTLVLLAMLVVCPIIGWRKMNRRAIVWLSALFGLVICATIALRFLAPQWPSTAVLLFALTAIALFTLLQDVLHAVSVRKSMTGESPVKAFLTLVRKNKRRYGGYLTHVGVAILVAGIIGSSFFTQEFESEVNIGESFNAGPWELHFKDINIVNDPEKRVYQAILDVKLDGNPVGTVTPEKHLHRNSEQPMTEVSIHFNLLQDLYIIFSPVNERGRSYFKVLISPLVLWIWIGGLLIVLGGTYALIPNRRSRLIAVAEGAVDHD